MLELELQKKFIILYSFERKKYADIEAELDIKKLSNEWALSLRIYI